MLLVFSLLFAGCSSDDSSDENAGKYFRLKANGTDINFGFQYQVSSNYAVIKRRGDVFELWASYGMYQHSQNMHNLLIYFEKNGDVISVVNSSGSVDYGSYEFKGYDNFPENYFNLEIVSLDETNKKIKINLNGNLYLNELDLNSEKFTLDGQLAMSYEDSDEEYGITFRGIDQYCKAKLNNQQWTARREKTASSFTAADPYKIEIHFAQDAVPGTYPVSNNTTGNYIRFARFNTQTLTYDYYNVVGTLAHSYREYHGAGDYSYIGTFNFTATNPNNPADVIQITDGTFRSYQMF